MNPKVLSTLAKPRSATDGETIKVTEWRFEATTNPWRFKGEQHRARSRLYGIVQWGTVERLKSLRRLIPTVEEVNFTWSRSAAVDTCAAVTVGHRNNREGM